MKNIDFTTEDRNLTFEVKKEIVKEQINSLKNVIDFLSTVLEDTIYRDDDIAYLGSSVENLMGDGGGLSDWDYEEIDEIYSISPDDKDLTILSQLVWNTPFEFDSNQTIKYEHDFQIDYESNNRRAIANTISNIGNLYTKAYKELVSLYPTLNDDLDNDFEEDLYQSLTPIYGFAYEISEKPDLKSVEIIAKNAPDIVIMEHKITDEELELNRLIDVSIFHLRDLQNKFIDAFESIEDLGFAVDITKEKQKALDILSEANYVRNEIIEKINPKNGLTEIPHELDWSDTKDDIYNKFDYLILDISKERFKKASFYIASNSSEMDKIQVAYSALYLDDKLYHKVMNDISLSDIDTSLSICETAKIELKKEATTDNPYAKDYCTVPDVDTDSSDDTNKNKSTRKNR